MSERISSHSLTSGHYGLASMIERTESHQGSLKINSTAGKGTTITLAWARDSR